MALFTDSAIVTIDDLLLFEASLIQVASSHSINVDNKIALATSAISDKLMLWLLNSGNSDPQFQNRRMLGVSNVVVTTPLKRWLCLESLSRIFGEAYNIQLNTRYQGKWMEYQNEAASSANLCYLAGVGLVNDPLPRPAIPLLSVQAGNMSAQSLFVSTVWTNGSGEESSPSAQNSVTLHDNSGISVAMAEGAIEAPSAAVGWNIYVSSQFNLQTKQNQTPLAIGSTWDMPVTGLQIGSVYPSGGQTPTIYVSLLRQLKRG